MVFRRKEARRMSRINWVTIVLYPLALIKGIILGRILGKRGI